MRGRSFFLLIGLLTVLVVGGIGLFAYDILRGQKSAPTFFHAPSFFCKGYWRGITLPPVGIFICPRYFSDDDLRKHELVHWEQYRRTSTLGFYTRYLAGWVAAGFSYHNIPMEQEARAVGGN